MVLEQESRSVGVPAGLFVGSERDDDVAVRPESLAFQADQGLRERGVAVFHIDGAAAVEIAVLFRELERIGRPVLGFGLHDIEMAQEKSGPSGMLAAVAHDDITLGWMILRRDEYHVARPKARRQHPGLDGLGRLGGSMCVGGI